MLKDVHSGSRSLFSDAPTTYSAGIDDLPQEPRGSESVLQATTALEMQPPTTCSLGGRLSARRFLTVSNAVRHLLRFGAFLWVQLQMHDCLEPCCGAVSV